MIGHPKCPNEQPARVLLCGHHGELACWRRARDEAPAGHDSYLADGQGQRSALWAQRRRGGARSSETEFRVSPRAATSAGATPGIATSAARAVECASGGCWLRANDAANASDGRAWLQTPSDAEVTTTARFSGRRRVPSGCKASRPADFMCARCRQAGRPTSCVPIAWHTHLAHSLLRTARVHHDDACLRRDHALQAGARARRSGASRER